MSESRKRSRKSKLEIREDYDLEVVRSDDTATALPLQKNSRYFACSKVEYFTDIPVLLDHDYCKTFRLHYTYVKPNTSIKAPKYSAWDKDEKSQIIAVKTEDDKRIKIEQVNLSDQFDSIVLDKMDLYIKPGPKKYDGTIRKCRFKPDTLFKKSTQIAETSDNIADKILDIEMRNVWGCVLRASHIPDPFDKKIQSIIELWQSWSNSSKHNREPPLFYQCHICHQSWWRLHQFREHIKTHDSDSLRVFFKEHFHESFVIASNEAVENLIYIETEGNCYKCGNDVEYHKNFCDGYICQHCSKSLYTCSSLRDHKSQCIYTNIAKYNISADRQCTICNTVSDSISLKDQHMIESHSVPSDLPISAMLKICNSCDSKYAIYNLHSCSKSVRNAGCENCCRKFASNKLAVTHFVSRYNQPIKCRICKTQLRSKCQEMEHLLEYHTKNYTLAFKCTICTDINQLFLDDMSIKAHRNLEHCKKSDKRRLYFEMMLVPKSCLEGDCIEETTVPAKSRRMQKKENYDKIFGAHASDQFIGDITPDMVAGEIEIKKEPTEINDEDYEEMLLKMFNQNQSQKTINNKVKGMKSSNEDTPREFDFSNVKIKAETVEEIDITDNPVVKIKTESIDHDEVEAMDFNVANIKIERQEINDEIMVMHSEAVNKNHDWVTKSDVKVFNNDNVISKQAKINKIDIETAAVVIKKERDSITDEMVNFPDGVVVKQEIDDTFSTIKTENESNESESMDTSDSFNISTKNTKEGIISEFESEHINNVTSYDNLKSPESEKELKILKYNRIPAEDMAHQYSVDVLNAQGKVKQKKLYTCAKCGYTAHHKKYRTHKNSICAHAPKNSSSYPCTKCGLNFIMFTNYVIHFEKHGYNVSTCFVCGASVPSSASLSAHVHRHIKTSFLGMHMLDKSGEELPRKKRGTCQLCQEAVEHQDMFSHWEGHLKLKEANEIEDPVLQIKEEVDDEPELTIDCERVTMNNKELEPSALKLALEHLQADSNEKECIICYRLFSRRYDLKRHIVEHLLMDAHMKKNKSKAGGGAALRCQLCAARFAAPERYKFHMRGHGGMPIFMCELCNKTFSDSSNFAKHKKTHNVRCLVCDICQKKFHSKNALEKHIFEHYTRPLSKCSDCAKTFHSKTTLKKHRTKVHVRPKYKCIICDATFLTLQKKWNHDWEVHKERKHAADCPICLKSFRKFSDVKSHAREEHGAAVSALRDKRGDNLQLFQVRQLKKKKETIVICE